VGYDVHITRKENWFDENGPAISLDEWAAVDPDPKILRKMFVIAQNLAAKVQGDEGEIYGSDGDPT
jgi:hypothetical protein